MTFPTDHPLRYALNNELHARPFAELQAPEQTSHFAMVSLEDGGAADRAHLLKLCRRAAVAQPAPDATHFAADFGTFRLKWERHSEFTTYTFFHGGRSDEVFAKPASSHVPVNWLEKLPGERLVAAHVALEDAAAPERTAQDLERDFATESLCCSKVLGGAAKVWTDFRLHEDGFTRILIRDVALSPQQAGRLVQRLLEGETYRNMALLGLPVARETGPKVARIDKALAGLTARMKSRGSTDDEHLLLEELTALSAEIEEISASTAYRFSATRAYEALVESRIQELREDRVEGYSPVGAFIERRFAPAMRTCESVAGRQDVLSKRVTRAANLLRTRVDVALEGQNRDLLESMDRRARLQLRLQQTVEGLSVAAITYYLVGLVGYGLKAVNSAGMPVDVDLWQGVSIPVVGLLIWSGVRRVRRKLNGDAD